MFGGVGERLLRDPVEGDLDVRVDRSGDGVRFAERCGDRVDLFEILDEHPERGHETEVVEDAGTEVRGDALHLGYRVVEFLVDVAEPPHHALLRGFRLVRKDFDSEFHSAQPLANVVVKLARYSLTFLLLRALDGYRVGTETGGALPFGLFELDGHHVERLSERAEFVGGNDLHPPELTSLRCTLHDGGELTNR